MKSIKIILIAIAVLLVDPVVSYAQMTDDQVVSYARTALASGKSQNQIAQELIARGVTREQVVRLRGQYNQTASQSVTEQALTGNVVSRKAREDVMMDGTEVTGRGMVDSLASGEVKMPIFGRDLFSSETLTFEPNENGATPENYRLGPGDRIRVDIWGDNEATIEQVVSPEGRIFVSQVGPVQLGGITIKAATERIKKAVSSKYANVGSGTSVSVSLTQIRTIRVNVMGDVNTPGTYRLSSFSTVFTALYRAGGITEQGSLRAVKVVRGGNEIAVVDLYGYLLEGDSDSDIHLQDGDAIVVPPYLNRVILYGKVKRPMAYELVEGETLETLFNYAGGFAGDAYTEDFCIVRQCGKEKEVLTVKNVDCKACTMEDGDVVTVGSSLDRFSNKIEVRGCVFRPGMYAFGGDIATLKQLIKAAGGLKEDAFTSRALIMREKDDLSLESISVDLGAVLSGNVSDILLQKNDILLVSSIHELEDMGTLTIVGYVANPGSYAFAENTTVEDLILQAGGLLDGASLVRIDVDRRISDASVTHSSEKICENFTLSVKDGFVVDGGPKFILRPYDVVSVRMSPSYFEQIFVNISGEVTFPGDYAISTRSERLSDIVRRSGGLTDYAYIPGAHIIRSAGRDEGYLNKSIESVYNKTGAADSLNVDRTNRDEYNVSVDLKMAMEQPGSIHDIVLQQGDRIVIPELVNTIRVEGEVMFPVALTYQKGCTAREYINRAGGYSADANRGKAFVIYPDGHAVRVSSASSKIEPGSVIVVPMKKERKGMSPSEIMAIATSTTSLATLVVTLVKLFVP